MGIFRTKNNSGNRCVNFSYVDGLAGYMTNDAVAVTINKDTETVDVKARAFKRPEVSVPFTNIIDVKFVSDTEISEKDKSVFGRAAVGALLFGPLGAVVGGMSGIGTKKTTAKRNFIIITHNQGGDEKAIAFEIVGASLKWDVFYDELKNLIK